MVCLIIIQNHKKKQIKITYNQNNKNVYINPKTHKIHHPAPKHQINIKSHKHFLSE